MNLSLKTYVKVSIFALNVNFSIFLKNLVPYVTPSIYCSSFYSRILVLLGGRYGFRQPFL